MPNLLARNFENLLHLKAIVDAGSFNRASKLVGLSQPALTRSIGRLESALGVQLLTRVARGVYPTEFGQALLGHIGAADTELEQAATVLRIMKGRAGSQLACGGSFVPMGYLIPLAVREFAQDRPEAHVRLVEGTTDALLRMLRLGELEVVVCPKMDAQQEDDDLAAEPLITERVGIFADRQHPLLKQSNHNLKKLAARERWILPDRTGQLRQLLIAQFAQHGVDLPERFIESSSMEAARRLISLTGYILFSTSLLVAPDLLAGAIRELQGDWHFPTTTLTLFHRNQTLSAAAQFFIERLRRVVRSLPPSERAPR
jgi:LysR family transcriptional regulator, pca operon transcriptional activator